MKKLLSIIVMGLLLSGHAYAKSITLKDLINDGKIYIGMSKTQLARTGGFPSIKKLYAEVFECNSNTIRDYYPSKRMEILAGGADSTKKRDVEGNRVFFIFKNVTKPSKDDGGSSTCNDTEYRGNGILAKWFFTLKDAESFVIDVSDKKNLKIESEIQTYKDTCSTIGFKPGSEKFADCVMKLMDKEEKKSTSDQKIEQDNQKLDKKKYDDEERIRKREKYNNCLKKTTELYGEPRKSCALELL